MVVIEAKGSDVLAALNNGVSAYPEQKGAFPQVAGITYTIDEATSTVTDIMVGDEPIDLEKTYKVATNDFIAAGGDEYTMFKDCKVLVELSALNEILAAYIRELGAVDAKVEGRMKATQTIKPEPVEEALEPVEPTPFLNLNRKKKIWLQ